MFIPRLRAAMLLLALLLSNPTFGTTAAGADAATESLLAADAELTRALVAGDVRALNAIYADDFVYVHSTGGVDTRKQFVDTIRTGRLRFKSMTRVDSREPILSSNVRTYGDAGILSAVHDLVLIDPPGGCRAHRFGSGTSGSTSRNRDSGAWRRSRGFNRRRRADRAKARASYSFAPSVRSRSAVLLRLG